MDIVMGSLTRQGEEEDCTTRYWGLTKYPNHRKVSKILLRTMLKLREIILRCVSRPKPCRGDLDGVKQGTVTQVCLEALIELL